MRHGHSRWVLMLADVLVLILVVTLVVTQGKGPPLRPGTGHRSALSRRFSGETTKSVPTAPEPSARSIGTSVQGRPIELMSFGGGSRRILIIGGVHGNEYGTRLATALVEYLRANPTAVPAGSTVDIVACANPDGLASASRANSRGVDINRNFPTRWSRRGARRGESSGKRPASEPETRAIMSLLAQRHYCRVIALHSTGPLVDFDGPGARALARRIAQAAEVRVVRLADLHAYAGSMGQYVPANYGIPNITWELGSGSLTPRVLAGFRQAMQ